MANKSIGTSDDRVTLNVGGEKFFTASSTLISNSEYFAALLSDDWISSDEIFLDQDPVAFRTLLTYMRCGVIKVDDIDIGVLILAEFLSVEKLLLAIKIRWYCNIGKGPVPPRNDDQEIADREVAAAFDQVHGGIRKAITSGLYPIFLRQDDVNADKDFISLYILNNSVEQFDDIEEMTRESVKIKELAANSLPLPDCTGGIVGALNGIHSRGYTKHEQQFLTERDEKDYDSHMFSFVSFSQRKHSTAINSSSAKEIFIPSENEAEKERETNSIKQFALQLDPAEWSDVDIFAPAEYSENPQVRENPFATETLTGTRGWMEEHQFITREKEYEKLFKTHLSMMSYNHVRDGRPILTRLYSRKIARPPITQQEGDANMVG